MDRMPSEVLSGDRSFSAASTTKPNFRIWDDNRVLSIFGKAVDSIAILRTKVLRGAGVNDCGGLSLGSSVFAGVLEFLEECHVIAFGHDHQSIPSLYDSKEYAGFMRNLVCWDGGIDSFEQSDNFDTLSKHLYPNLQRVHNIATGAESLSPESQAFFADFTENKQSPYMQFLVWAMSRRFCRSANGRLGWVALQARVGDKICLFYGGDVLFTVRQESDEHIVYYRCVGECYLDGLMNGEAITMDHIQSDEFHIR